MPSTFSFAIIPLPSKRDSRKWERFIVSVEEYRGFQTHFKKNHITLHYHSTSIEFKVGENHPILPLDGTKFYGLSDGGCGDEKVTTLVEAMCRLARVEFGNRVKSEYFEEQKEEELKEEDDEDGDVVEEKEEKLKGEDDESVEE